MTDLIGKTLGNYRVVEQLGRGGMAAVYKAFQPALERYVAIKVIHEQLVAQDEQFFKRFHREAKVVASLHHPNIVPVFDFGVEGDVPYMVMEYLQGRSLKAELQELNARGEIMPTHEVVRIVRDVAGAVDYAYRRGIVHHDLKPDNVMLTTKGETILTDFGIAKIAGGTQVTVSGAVMGTPTYMSPEQGKGERGDQRSDVYSLGVILYEMVTGRVPFEADTPLAVIFKHISDPLPLPRSLNPAIPERVEQVILRALAKASEDRFQSTALMARALEEAITAEQAGPIRQPPGDETTLGEALLPPVKEPAETLAAPGVTPTEQAPLPRRAARRSVVPIWARIAGGVVLVSVALVLGILGLRNQWGRAPASTVAADGRPTSTSSPTVTAVVPGAAYPLGSRISIDLGTANQENGIMQFEFADGMTLPKTIDGREVRATADNPTSARYMYFNVDDRFLSAEGTSVAVTVTYYDQGSFSFWIDYDSTDVNATGAGVWKLTRTENPLTDSRQWRTVTFVLPDAFFGGRQHDDADFRIASGDKELYIDSVTVSTLPPVVGPPPSERVATFYYPWYRNAATDGEWVHWQEPDFQPPSDISSDYYPQLGAYSSVDPATVAQHFAWLREAGVGMIISSWWGQGSLEDQAARLLLDLGEVYDVRVAFHIEPYAGRTADRLLDDVQYLYARYGEHPAFYRTRASSRWSPDDHPKGLFFVWSIESPDTVSDPVGASYWSAAMDGIHGIPEGGLVIANTTRGDWIDGGHFDGLYNYATLHLEEGGGFSWSRALPPEAWYVPCVIPGFSARRIGYPENTWVPRKDGATYDEQWAAALDTGVEPAMVAITSFNEWHEGTQIEPASVGAPNGRGESYADYGALAPAGYFAKTREWVDLFLSTEWPPTYRIRVRIVTTSDWTTLALLEGASWIRPGLATASEAATTVGLEEDLFRLIQPIERAQAGGMVEMVVDVLLSEVEAGATLVFEIERGHLGSTKVELFNYHGADLILVKALNWGGIRSGERNASTFQVPAEGFLESAP